MDRLKIVHLDSLEALRASADAWDDLWQRSDATLPLLRAEMLAQWVEHFAQPKDFQAVAVEDDGRLVAALPLVWRKLGHLMTVAAMPCNEWAACGDLLWDTAYALGVEVLASELRRLAWQTFWLDEALLDESRWLQFGHAIAALGMTVVQRGRWQVGRVRIDGDWSGYKARWSRKHRQKMAWAARRLAQCGQVHLALHSKLDPDQATQLMQTAFEIEDRSWKGDAGTSILRTPGMDDFFLRQARLAAQWGQLELAFLYCDDLPAAFSYGLSAKGVFHSIKIGYDRQFAAYEPGQLLRYYLLERMFAEPWRKWLDFQGPLTPAHTVWQPERYTVGRLAAAPRGSIGSLAIYAYKYLWK